ncbi:MAG: J domain-containing protein [Thiotrichales bacterium]|nr:J domain-containing protein [Thiotrichales bacterium]
MSRSSPDSSIDRRAEEATALRRCDFPGCVEPGLHRAPVSRDRLNEYYWFCLDHVRDYNAAWNYYEGMEEDEIEAHRRQDTVWQRPTWPLGGLGKRASLNPEERIRDGFGFFSEDGPAPPKPRPQSEEERALAVLDIKAPASLEAIKARYKQLAKRLHPDANGGDKAAEERLKLINQAYSTLKKLITA